MKLVAFVTARAGFGLLVNLLLSLPAFADYTATGKFQYQDREFNLTGFTGAINPRPIRFASVRIMSGETTLATGTTNTSGEFSIVVPGSTAQAITALCVATSTSPGPLLDLRVANDDFTFGDFYSVSSAQVNSPGTGTVDIGTTLATASTDIGKAFNIWDVVNDSFEFVASPGANGSLPTVKLTVIWRATHARTGSFFQGGTNRFLFIGSLAGYDDTIVSHEFGHFIDNVFSRSDSPGGAHSLGDAAQDIRLAWGEGLATFLGSSARNFKGYPRPDIYVNTDGTNLSFSYEIETLTGSVPSGMLVFASKTGSTNEAAVSAALWDITDGANTPDGTPGTDDAGDNIQRPFADVWKVLRNYLPTIAAAGISIEDFWDGWFSPIVNNGGLEQMEAIFAAVNGIEFKLDAQEPDNSAAAAPNAGLVQLTQPAAGARVVINEIDPGAVDALELYNAGNTEVDLSGWRVIGTRPGFTTATFTMPPFRLAAGAAVVLSEAAGTSTNSVLYFGSNISWDYGAPGACALIDAGGTGRDFVRWGGSTELPPTGTSFAGNPASPAGGKTLGRGFTSADTDSAADWTEQIRTIGTFNQTGQEKHHTFYPAGDSDMASFNAVSGRNYLLESLNLQSGADTLIEVIATDGTTVLAGNDDFGSSKASRLVWTAPSSGKFYIRASRYQGASNLVQYGSYDLRIIESTSPLSIALPETLTVSLPGQGGKFQRISDAIAAAGSGDTIKIMDNGIYPENLTITGKSVTLKAASGKSPVLDGRGGTTLRTLYLNGAKNAKIEGLTILGGIQGIRVTGGIATIANTVVLEASDPGGFSDGIEVSGAGSSATIINCTVLKNGRVGIGVFNNATARIVNSIVKNNALLDVGGNVSASNIVVRNSLVGGGLAGSNGNIDGDPGFVDPANDDYRLQASSPAIDKGDAADPDLPTTDANGISRSLDGNGDGTATPDMGAYEYLPSGLLTSTSIFPQIAAGGGYRTSIIGVNTGAVQGLVKVSLTGSDGNPFPVTVLKKSGSFFDLSLAPMGTARLETSVLGGTVSGYAKFLSNIPITGSALFKVLSGDRITSEAGVGLAKPARSFTVYIDNLNNAFSGYAVANFGASTANLNLTLRDKNGASAGSSSLSLPAGQHIAQFAFERFNNASAGFEGSIEFTSDQNVAAVALRYDNTNLDSTLQAFSTIPVLVDEAATTLYFPQVADGGGYKTNFILVNPTSSSTTARIDFFASNGTALSLPIGGVPRTGMDVPLSAKGVARIITDGTSSVTQVGWVRVTCPAAIGGSAIFQTFSGGRITSEAGVASSPLAPHFTGYVESLGSAESGIAICNPNSIAVTVTLKLRNSAGEVVAQTSFNLPPLGHIPRFFTQFFSGFGDFEGTLEVLATGTVSAVALRYDNPGGDVFATIPVIVIP